MRKLPVDKIINKIKREETFSCVSSNNSFSLTIKEYSPYLCAAIHNGNHLRTELQEKIALSPFERWYEEDPFTGEFISLLPLRIIAQDSRYEYDINRRPDLCIYDIARGKKVWKTLLTEQEKQYSLEKHQQFYMVVEALLNKLLEKFGACVVYDIHSYNYKRIPADPPLFNIGTENITSKEFDETIDQWCSELAKIKIPTVKNRVAINEVFKGRGYFLEFITTNFDHALVLATEIKNILR